MHYFIFPKKDSYITETSPSSVKQYPDSVSKNYGSDEILELKKNFENSYSTAPYNISRLLIQFDYSDLNKEIDGGNITNPKYFLRLYEVEGQKELSEDYILGAYPLSQSWDEGTGKYFDNPKVSNGVTWDSASTTAVWDSKAIPAGLTFEDYYSTFDSVNYNFNDATASNNFWDTGSRSTTGGVWYNTQGFVASQSFQNQSGDIEMDVTDIVKKHLNGVDNNGFILKFSGSYEVNGNSQNLKFFSRNTHTIYAPKLEVRWDDSNFSTGTLNELTMSGDVENYFFVKGLKKSYSESEKVKFTVGARKKFEQKTFKTSALTSSFYASEGKMQYSIVDVGTNTPIVPFSNYTSMSCARYGMYFTQWLNTFEPGRYYKILFKVNYEDGQQIVYDNNEEFKIV
tara:strand:+ start:3264 stop:4457 length:1194 start_codon:yes stop_codon:yes gene_type:complete